MAKKYLKSHIEKSYSVTVYFTYDIKVTLSETKISDSLAEIKIRDALSETKQKVTLCIRQKSYSLPITKFHV